MQKINDMLLKLEVFQYATSLDLNMGYYHIQLRETQVTYVEDAKPIRLQTYPVLKVNEEMFRKETERLLLLGVFKVANDSEWRAP